MASMADTAANPTRRNRRRPATRGSGEALRAEILEAAGAILAASGDASQVTLRGVARRVGIAATSIYLHFSDVEQLLLEVKQLRFTEFNQLIQDAADAAGEDPTDRIRAMGRAYVDFGITNPGHYRVLFSAPIHTALVPSELGYLGSASFSLISREAARLLGVADDDPDAQLLATDLWCAVHGMVHLRSMKTTFPWPEVHVQVDGLVARLVTR